MFYTLALTWLPRGYFLFADTVSEGDLIWTEGFQSDGAGTWTIPWAALLAGDGADDGAGGSAWTLQSFQFLPGLVEVA